MVFILFIVVCLVAWALHLMQEAVQRREFSLMLAGLLVSTSAAAMMAVYFLMGHYVGYVSELSQREYLSSRFSEVGWTEVSNISNPDFITHPDFITYPDFSGKPSYAISPVEPSLTRAN